MKKTGLLFLTLMLSAALLCGCASNADSLASPSPGVNNSMAPQASPGTMDPANGLNDLLDLGSPSPDGAGGMEGGSAEGGISSLEDAKKASEEMGDAVEKLSEVDDAYVVAVGENALVGVQLNDQYQGGVDERLKKMILSRVQTVNKAVTGVAVTDDRARLKEIQALAETLNQASSLNSVSTQATDLMKQITVYRE